MEIYELPWGESVTDSLSLFLRSWGIAIFVVVNVGLWGWFLINLFSEETTWEQRDSRKEQS